MKVKLWDESVDKINTGQIVLVKNIVLDLFGGRNTMAATPETEIIVS